ncbi:acetyl-CoA C-acyltransferase [Rhodobacteraceae bacterium WD3A24]|nr:acetyl-CoA C-acyltransferase [Rhodobacteraceae bacterium WD3A24]
MDAYIFDGARSAFGRYGGALAHERPDDLLAGVIAALLERNPMTPEAFEDVLTGCANQAGEDARNVSRHAALRAGLPVCVAAQTVNRLCGSGLAALVDAGRAVHLGDGDLLIAGGVESMSRAPFVTAKAEGAFSRQNRTFDSTIGARFPNPVLEAKYGNDTMPETADNIASDLGIARERADRFAARSQAHYSRARNDGFYAGEIIPVEVTDKRGRTNGIVDADEHPRPETRIEKLAELRPLQSDGVVTAGNASGVNDGAAALIVGTLGCGRRHGLVPRARILSAAVAGVEPRVMGLGPVPASEKALARAGLSLGDMDVIEINEAFATQVLGCLEKMGIDDEDPRVNPNGGAIAIGHPLGASGARLALTAMRQLEASGSRYALVTMCIGVGQGIAAVIERVESGF